MRGAFAHPDGYDRNTHRLLTRMRDRIIDDIAAAGLEPGSRILDVGTGPGRLPLAIAAAFPTLRVDAVDLSAEMIEYARGVAGDAPVTFAVGDVARLPFPVPTEPIYAARAELFDEPFSEFALPQAVLRFRQGFGRLIRRKSDRGVFVVLDRRIISRDYGQAFLSSLPRTRVIREPISTMPQRVERWLAPR